LLHEAHTPSTLAENHCPMLISTPRSGVSAASWSRLVFSANLGRQSSHSAHWLRADSAGSNAAAISSALAAARQKIRVDEKNIVRRLKCVVTNKHPAPPECLRGKNRG